MTKLKLLGKHFYNIGLNITCISNQLTEHNFYDANFSETRIQYSESELAIVKTQFDLSNENIICTKVWYNGNLKWEDNETERLIEIRK
mgnify:CR=1 FL=1